MGPDVIHEGVDDNLGGESWLQRDNVYLCGESANDDHCMGVSVGGCERSAKVDSDIFPGAGFDRAVDSCSWRQLSAFLCLLAGFALAAEFLTVALHVRPVYCAAEMVISWSEGGVYKE